MKIRNLIIAFVITFSGLTFSACTDESENIVPNPVNTDEAVATVGDEPEENDPMD